MNHNSIYFPLYFPLNKLFCDDEILQEHALKLTEEEYIIAEAETDEDVYNILICLVMCL